MTHHNVLYACTSFVAGVVTVCLGSLAPAFLTIGAGPLFFAALLIANLNSSQSLFRGNQGRLWSGLVVCSAGYMLAFLAFNFAFAYSPELLNIEASDDVIQFRADVWLGLAAAGCVAALALYVLTTVLANARRPTVFFRALLCGIVAVVATYLVNLRFQHYWSFMGVLLPVGETLFGCVAGPELEHIGLARGDEKGIAAGS
jgi:hypothetical protein